MTVEELLALFAKHGDKFLTFPNVENKRSNRPDLHAFLLLDALVSSNKEMICAAEHDEIYLEPEPSKLAEVINEEQVIELIRCGVRFNNVDFGLRMFV